MVSEMIFDLQAAGGKLTGTAHMGNWPGDAPLVDGKLDGNRISFTAYGKSLWRARNAAGEAAGGLPKLTFTGTIHGDEMQLTLVWDSVMIYGKQGAAQELEMKAKRNPE